jgi:ubiquinone/menaquinone biosynthesis C-methylase UbiE
MAKQKTSKGLKTLYNKVYRKGKDNFFSFSTDYVTREVINSINFKNKKVLEIGCGAGDTALSIAKHGGQILATDLSKEAINIAKKKKHKNLEFKAVTYDKVQDTFDIIVLQEVIEHMDNPLQVLRKLKKKLKPKGKIVIACPSFMNVRGYVWMTLVKLFDVPMSLSDINFLCPFDFEEYAVKLNMKLKWHTFNTDLGNNNKMIVDMKKRLTNALTDAKMKADAKALLKWLEQVSKFDHKSETSGAKGFYILGRKK